MQNEIAKVVIDRVPCVEMVRFVNSGTEACLSVLRLMRAYTGREKVRGPVAAYFHTLLSIVCCSRWPLWHAVATSWPPDSVANVYSRSLGLSCRG